MFDSLSYRYQTFRDYSLSSKVPYSKRSSSMISINTKKQYVHLKGYGKQIQFIHSLKSTFNLFQRTLTFEFLWSYTFFIYKKLYYPMYSQIFKRILVLQSCHRNHFFSGIGKNIKKVRTRPCRKTFGLSFWKFLYNILY